MPRLPGVAESLPIPQPARGGARQPVSQTGSALAGLGNELFAIAEREREVYDKTLVESKYNEILAEQLDLTQGEENGFKQIRSGDAQSRNLLEEYTERFDTAYERIAQGLNSRQSQMLRQRYDMQRMRMSDDILTHVAQEKEVWHKQTFETTLSTVAQQAGLNWDNLKAVDAEIVRAESAARDRARQLGLEPAMADELRRASVAGIHQAVIDQAIANNNPGYAKVWLQSHEKDIDTKVAAGYLKTINSAEDLGEAQRLVDDIVDKHPNLSETEAKKLLRGARPDVRKEAESILSSRYTDREQDRVRMERGKLELYEDFALRIESDPNFRYEDIRTGDLLAMTAAQRNNLRTIQSNRGKVNETDWDVYTALRLLPDSELVKISPADYRGKLADPEYKKIVDDVDALRNPSADKLTIASGGRSFTKKADQAFEKVYGKGKANSDTGNFFWSQLETEQQKRVEILKRQMTAQEEDDLIKDMLTETALVRMRGGFGSSISTALFGPTYEDEGRVYEVTNAGAIPEADRTALIERYKASNNGQVPSDNDLLNMWRILKFGEN